MPETLSIEGRAAFYDSTGAYRDMVVTHLFQVLGFVAMEPPASLEAKALKLEKAKVYDALRPIDVRHVVRGQYEGYRSEPGVPPDSQTETMVAVRAEVDNWRWAGVPFFLRSGKNLGASRQVITLGFEEPPLRMFRIERQDAPAGYRNELVIDFADPGSITVRFLAKEPGDGDHTRRGHDGVPLPGLLRPGQFAGGVRAPDPAGHARRSVPVHQLGQHRATVGDLRAAAAQPAARAAVRTGIVGPSRPPAAWWRRSAGTCRRSTSGGAQCRGEHLPGGVTAPPGARPFAGFAVAAGLGLTLGLLAVAGAVDTITVVFRQSILQAMTPERLRGRVLAADYVVGAGGPQVGNLEAGALASLTTPVISAVTGGLITVAGAVVLGVALPGFRRYRYQPDRAPALPRRPGSHDGPAQDQTRPAHIGSKNLARITRASGIICVIFVTCIMPDICAMFAEGSGSRSAQIANSGVASPARGRAAESTKTAADHSLSEDRNTTSCAGKAPCRRLTWAHIWPEHSGPIWRARRRGPMIDQ